MQKYFIKTWGCQMNVLDGDKMASLLENLGYEKTENLDEANIILLNTCSVREGPENKVFSELLRLKTLKEKNLEILGVVGCVAQQEKEEIFRKAPFVDLVMGPRSIMQLPSLLNQAKNQKVIETSFSEDTLLFPKELLERSHPTKASITIMEGCNKRCTYCIVPETRGREVYRPFDSIVEEVKICIDRGYKEIELLGQNVNCYKDREKRKDFCDLLDEVSQIEGVKRVRFITSHPRHFPIEVAKLIGERENICKFLHLPMQAGSSRILKLMKRQYEREFYLELTDNIKEIVKDIALSSDFIVGFPTETEEEFEETLECIRRVKYDTIFAFVYSPRPGTEAAKLKPVEKEIAKMRLSRLLEEQNKIQIERFSRYFGKEIEVLLEGKSKKGGQYMGRSDDNKVVNFTSSRELQINNFYKVKITESLVHSLKGEEVF
jgi:tRNA-2-methylthio-N6-dimethylallyladenosine synthase